MDDKYYTIDGYIAHKSCIFDGTNFSNSKYVQVFQGIDWLKQKCAMLDKIDENIDIQIYYSHSKEIIKFPFVQFVQMCSYNFCTRLYGETNIDSFIDFRTYEEFYDYMCINHHHLIKNRDIKIALKD